MKIRMLFLALALLAGAAFAGGNGSGGGPTPPTAPDFYVLIQLDNCGQQWCGTIYLGAGDTSYVVVEGQGYLRTRMSNIQSLGNYTGQIKASM